MLAIRGHADPRGPTIGEVADYLLLRHHSTVGLIDRADAGGLVRRTRDEDDHRVVRLQLTEMGAECLATLSALHLEELDRLAPQLSATWEGLAPVQRTHGFSGSPIPPPEAAARRPVTVGIGRVSDELGKDPAGRVLVDRLWPRGLARSDAPFEVWAKNVAPSPELRRWYGHVAGRFAEFSLRYRQELATGPSRAALDELRHRALEADTVVLTATKDLEHSGAAVLKDELAGS
jgi:uncharacterized protein YeaO (DUF488 family)